MAKTRNRRKAKVASHSLRKALPVLLGIVVMMSASVVLYYGFVTLRTSPRLFVQQILISGNTRVPQSDILTYAGLKTGQPILGLSLNSMVKNLERHPWIQTAAVRRQLPDTVRVEITEHQPKIAVSLGEVYLANADGEPFKRLDALDGIVFPIITGLTRQDAEQDAVHVREVVREGTELWEGFAKHRGEARVEELHWDRDLGWNVVVQHDGHMVRMHLGHEPHRRVETGWSALNAMNDKGQRPKEIWADLEDAGRVHVAVAAAR